MPRQIHPRNHDRAERARVALDAFTVITGDASTEEAATDLICDLLHLCDVERIDHSIVVRRAVDHYLVEISRPES